MQSIKVHPPWTNLFDVSTFVPQLPHFWRISAPSQNRNFGPQIAPDFSPILLSGHWNSPGRNNFNFCKSFGFLTTAKIAKCNKIKHFFLKLISLYFTVLVNGKQKDRYKKLSPKFDKFWTLPLCRAFVPKVRFKKVDTKSTPSNFLQPTFIDNKLGGSTFL